MVEKNHLEKAAKCLEEGVRQFPEDRDLSYKKVRVLSWLKRYSEALQEFERWETDDFESNLLMGDFYWYQNQCKKAHFYYQKAESLDSIKAFEEASVKAYFTCLERLAKETKAERKKNSKILETPLAELEKKEKVKSLKKNLILTEFTRNLETQERSSSYSHVLYKKDFSSIFSANFAIFDTLKNFGDDVLNDFSLAVGGSFRWLRIHESSVNFGFSIEPQFSFYNFQELTHQINLGANYFGLQGRHTLYKEKRVFLIAPFWGYYFSSMHFFSKLYFSLDEEGKEALSGLLKLEHTNSYVALSGWVSYGNGESSRPSLAQKENTEFISYGFKLGLELSSFIKPFLSFDSRSEKAFKRYAYQVGAVWNL